MTDSPTHRAPALPADLGAMRTVLAADRTLMAWLRTSLSMLSFGFTIYKFLETAAKAGALARPESPQRVGLFLVAMGTACMVLGVLDYWVTIRNVQKTGAFRLGRSVLFMSLLLALAGVALFAAIIERAV
jgi:putative membrane protein